MAEIQTYTNSGEMTQRFIEFVMMQSQHAALFLGQMENPQTGEVTVNLEAAKMFIDQLEMVREKTRGNLTSDESKILDNSLTNLRLVFVEVSKLATGHSEPVVEPKIESPASPAPDIISDSDTKKRFTKSYGA